MKSIKIRDLEILEQEKQEGQNTQMSMIKSISDLSVENKKKDALIQELSRTVAELNLDVDKMKGGNK